MGLTSATEFNGYAGLTHVLELAGQLELTPEQRTSTEALFVAMTSKATPLGQTLVAQERKLEIHDRPFWGEVKQWPNLTVAWAL